MKGVILAGGHGTRLRPLTNVTNKNLLPVGREPMIMYPIRKMKEAGITEICITCGSDHMGSMVELCRSGRSLGVDITYRVQEEALGIAHAIALCENFVGGDDFTVILGDNVFDDSIAPLLSKKMRDQAGVCVIHVPDPERFGVVEYDAEGKPCNIIEKPKVPPSNDAVIGIYTYPSDAFDVIRNMKPSARGEYEVTDLNNHYLKQGKMFVHRLVGEWIDCGTHESLYRANMWAYKKDGLG